MFRPQKDMRLGSLNCWSGIQLQLKAGLKCVCHRPVWLLAWCVFAQQQLGAHGVVLNKEKAFQRWANVF